MLRLPLSRPSAGTLARFAFEITTITIGILIALWIDGVRETRRDAALVRTAREQLTREIADNLRDVNDTAASRETHFKALMAGLELVDELRKSGTSSSPRVTGFGLSSPSFPRSAWDTAGRTGALALMDYGEVKTFSEVYDLQDLVDRTQERYVQRLTEGGTEFIAAVVPETAGIKTGRSDLDTARTQGVELLRSLMFYRELLSQLATQYKKAPAR